MSSDNKKRPHSSTTDEDDEFSPPVKKLTPAPIVGGRTTVAIVGTAGRNAGLLSKMSKPLFDEMVKEAINTVENVWKLQWSEIDLFSGGAAWSDHVAVSIYLLKQMDGTKLTLFLPCKMEETATSYRFEDDGKNLLDWRNNPGRSANYHHASFSKALGYNSMIDIQNASQCGAILDTKQKGFQTRNLQIAKAKRMIAFGWSGTGEPDTPGTLHAWKHCSGQKLHINLTDLKSKLPSEILIKK